MLKIIEANRHGRNVKRTKKFHCDFLDQRKNETKKKTSGRQIEIGNILKNNIQTCANLYYPPHTKTDTVNNHTQSSKDNIKG